MEKLWNTNYLRVMTVNFMMYFAFYLLTPLLPIYLSEQFHAPGGMIGVVLSGYVVAEIVARLFSGFIVDSFDRRTVLLWSVALFAAFFAGYPIASTLLMFAIVRTLHGLPFGVVTVANSTAAIDVLPSSRRNEGLGFYGLSNNLATAIAPTVGLLIYSWQANYTLLFLLAMVTAGIGLLINSTLRLRPRETVRNKQPLSLDRFLLLKGWSEGVAMTCYSFSYGVISTYLAIYGKEELGITTGTGLFFALLSAGLIMSRLVGARTLRQGHVTENASHGVLISMLGYLLFAAVHNPIGYYGAALIIGLGNGHMFPAFQTMFINLAPNSLRGTANGTLLTAWELGVGLGIIIGGVVTEHLSYHAAFWIAWVVNALGVAFYFLYVKGHFNTNKLR